MRDLSSFKNCSIKWCADLKKMAVEAHKSFYLRPSYISRQILSIYRLVDIKRYFEGFRAIVGMK